MFSCLTDQAAPQCARIIVNGTSVQTSRHGLYLRDETLQPCHNKAVWKQVTSPGTSFLYFYEGAWYVSYTNCDGSGGKHFKRNIKVLHHHNVGIITLNSEYWSALNYTAFKTNEIRNQSLLTDTLLLRLVMVMIIMALIMIII